MANVKMDLLQIGQQYSAVQLAHMWGYKSHHPLVKGMVTPSGMNIVILFVTKEKQVGATTYEDEIKGNILYMMGQERHGSDKRLLENLNTRKDDIYLFYREFHHTPFIYYGRCFLIDADIKENSPSEFEFLIENLDDGLDNESDIMDYIVNLPMDNGETMPLLLEGLKKSHNMFDMNVIRIIGKKPLEFRGINVKYVVLTLMKCMEKSWQMDI